MIIYTGHPVVVKKNDPSYVKGQIKKLSADLEVCTSKQEKRRLEKIICEFEKVNREHTEIRNSKTEWDNV